MNNEYKKVRAKILLIEDNAADIRLTKEVLQQRKIVTSLDIVRDGVEALDFLKKRGKFSNVNKPNLILLDLNLPKKNGFEVLEEIKRDEELKRIPVVILTVSDAKEDLIKAYNLHANCYVIKPLEMKEFYRIINSIVAFWFRIVMHIEDE
ncbi:MAG: response regulator [Promethearchaeota archaeon]